MAQMQLFDHAAIDRCRRRSASPRRNELLDVLELATVVARQSLSDYACPKSNHIFTQPQLLSCLILKTYLKLTYRGVVQMLETADGLRSVIGLTRVPAHTTLEAFAKRVLSPAMLDQAVARLGVTACSPKLASLGTESFSEPSRQTGSAQQREEPRLRLIHVGRFL